MSAMLKWLPLVLALGSGTMACAHSTQETRPERDPGVMTQVLRENAALRRQVQVLDDRLLRLERQLVALGVVTTDRELPVVPVQDARVSQPAAEERRRVERASRPATAPRRPASRSIGLGEVPSSRGPMTGEGSGDDRVDDSGDDLVDDDFGAHAVLATETFGDAGVEPRQYRLVGNDLVEMTRREPPPAERPKRRRDKEIKAEYAEAMRLLRGGRHRDAEAAFARFALDYPRHEYADNALYWKGEAAYDEGRYSDALEAFTIVVERYAGGNKAPDAVLKIGLCYDKLGELAQAKDVLQQLIAAYPGERASDIARARLAEIEL